ncbi:MAG: alpha/beta fold hydrolase [Myxococcota bacterium]
MKGIFNLARRAAQGRPPVGQTPADVVHRENKWSLLRYRPGPNGIRHKTPIVLLPSLINRHYVLDLMPGKSFAEFLVAQGHDVYCVDWGTPGPEDRYLELDDIADRYIGRALRVAARRSSAERPHVLGYCLGGTLAALHIAAHPESAESFVALAAPVDFHDEGTLSTWVRSPQFDVDALVSGFGNVPWQLMQASFHLLKPTLGLWKTVRLLDRAWDDRFLDSFFAIETWGNDNVSFPGACYRRYILELYQENRLVRGTMALSGRAALLYNIRCPLMILSFEHDHIVPAPSARCLAAYASSTDIVEEHLLGGHVGAVISSAAARELWPKISSFYIDREPKPAALRPSKPHVAPQHFSSGQDGPTR